MSMCLKPEPPLYKQRRVEMNLTNEEYIKLGGSKCPKCQSEDTEASDLEMDGDGAWSKVVCNACGFEYTDHYRLVGWAPR